MEYSRIQMDCQEMWSIQTWCGREGKRTWNMQIESSFWLKIHQPALNIGHTKNAYSNTHVQSGCQKKNQMDGNPINWVIQ